MAHLVVPMDGSPHSEAALEHAVEQFGDPAVTVLHSTDPVQDPDQRPGDPSEDWRTRIEDRTGSVFETAERVAEGTGAEVETERVSGPPAGVIVDYVETEDADHVVMGSHGRTGVARVLLGSVAEKVVRRSPVPVTVVR